MRHLASESCFPFPFYFSFKILIKVSESLKLSSPTKDGWVLDREDRRYWIPDGDESSMRDVSVQFSSVTQLCLTLCHPIDCSPPDLPVHYQLLEFTQIHVHWVGDAIQPSHPLSSPSPPAFILSQQQGLFKWVCSLPQVAKILEFQL